MQNNKWIGWIIVAVLVIGAIWYGGRQPSVVGEKEPIKIGEISAQTGIGITIGEEELKGALLAAKEINARGGVFGHPLQIVPGDVSIDKLKAGATVAQKLISVDKVLAIVGPQWDEPMQVVAPIAELAKVPLVGPDTTDTLKQEAAYSYLFSTWYDNRVGIRELLRHAQKHNLKRVVILMQRKAGFWSFTRDAFVQNAPQFGVQVVKEFEMGEPISFDFRTTLAKIKQVPHDAIFFVMSDPTQCVYLKQKKELGITSVSLGTESTGNPASLKECGAYMEGNTYFSTPRNDHEGYKVFAAAFEKEYGRQPLYPSAVTAYDGVGMIAKALVTSNLKGGESLRNALAAIKDYPGASLATMTFKENGFLDTPEDAFEMLTIKDGKFIKVE